MSSDINIILYTVLKCIERTEGCIYQVVMIVFCFNH